MRTKLPAASDRSYPVRKDRIHNQKQPVLCLWIVPAISIILNLSPSFYQKMMEISTGMMEIGYPHSISNIHGVLFKINCQIQKEDSWSYLQQKQGCEKTFIFSQPLLKSITEHPEHSQLKTH